MEQEFIDNMEKSKPQETDKAVDEDRNKVDELRGTPLSIGTLEEFVDENHAIVSGSMGPEYYVGIMSFVDKDQLEPGSSILMHAKGKSSSSYDISNSSRSYGSCRHHARRNRPSS